MQDDPVKYVDSADSPAVADGTEQLEWDGHPGVVAHTEAGASLDYGTTSAEQREGMSLDDRLSREEPDDPVTSHGSPLAGRLVEPDEGAHEDTDKDAVARETDTGDEALGWSPEESAMHIEQG